MSRCVLSPPVGKKSISYPPRLISVIIIALINVSEPSPWRPPLGSITLFEMKQSCRGKKKKKKTKAKTENLFGSLPLHTLSLNFIVRLRCRARLVSEITNFPCVSPVDSDSFQKYYYRGNAPSDSLRVHRVIQNRVSSDFKFSRSFIFCRFTTA